VALAFVRRALKKAWHKYDAVGEYYAGDWFASQRELRRWVELRLLRDNGQIVGLARQVRFPLIVRGKDGHDHTVGHYVADFIYRECTGGKGWAPGDLVVEDAKGFRTELYRWKKKHFEQQYGIVIRET